MHKLISSQRTLFSIETLKCIKSSQGVVLMVVWEAFHSHPLPQKVFCFSRSQVDPELMHACLKCQCLRTPRGKPMEEKALALCLKEVASQPASELPTLVSFARLFHFSAPQLPCRAGVWPLHYPAVKRKGVHIGTSFFSSLNYEGFHTQYQSNYHTAVPRPFACKKMHDWIQADPARRHGEPQHSKALN